MQAESTIAIKTKRKWSTHGKEKERVGRKRATHKTIDFRYMAESDWRECTKERRERSDYNAGGNR